MSSRREFIRHGMVASILAVCSPAAGAALAGMDRRSPQHAAFGKGLNQPYQFFRVLFDEASAEGASFGAEAATRGAPTRPVGMDLGAIWMHEIEPRWKRGPAAIAGLTGGAALFCLELLARDYGMGVVYRTRHARTAERSWARAAAVTAMTCPVSARPDARIDLVDLADDSRIAEAPLYSWVIAPADGAPALRG